MSITPDIVLALLRALEHLPDPRVQRGEALDQLQHALQTATRAQRAMPEDDELVAAALCHDIGKLFSWQGHGALAAEMLRPFVRPDVTFAIAVHEDFTPVVRAHGLTDLRRRRRHRARRGYALVARFADEFDTPAVDASYETLPLAHFEPLVRRVFAAPRYHRDDISTPRRVAAALFSPLRPLLGARADIVEDQALDAAAAVYRGVKRTGTLPRRVMRSAAVPPDREKPRK